MYLIYVDDSGDDNISTYTALAIPVQQWNTRLKGWLTFRKQLYKNDSIPTDYELHAVDWLSAHPTPIDEILDAQPVLLAHGKEHRRDRFQKFEAGLAVIGRGAGPRVFTVVSDTVRAPKPAHTAKAVAGSAVKQARSAQVATENAVVAARAACDASARVHNGAGATVVGFTEAAASATSQTLKTAERGAAEADQAVAATLEAQVAVSGLPDPVGPATTTHIPTTAAGVSSHDLYGRLVVWLDQWLAAEASHGLIILDGSDQGLKYRQRHRDLLDIKTRRIVEDPQPMPSHESQLVQMVDWCAHSAFRSIRAGSKDGPGTINAYNDKLAGLHVIDEGQYRPGVRWEK